MSNETASYIDQALLQKFEKIRDQFPALQQKIHGHRLAYLDNAASAQKPVCVLDSWREASTFGYANIHRGVHTLSGLATDHYENSREIVRAFINAPCASQIIFTKGATEAINTVAYGWAMQHLSPGDEIIVSVTEHISNLIPWYFLRESKGVKINFIRLNNEGDLSLEHFSSLLNDRTKLVAITHMSNLLGRIVPIEFIIKQAHSVGARVLVDGTQTIMHCPIDVEALNCDWFIFTGHKVYGPTGIGVLYGKAEALEEMVPFQGGGGIVEQMTEEKIIRFTRLPYCLEAGTPPFVEAVALGRALEFMEQIGLEDIFAYEKGLYAYTHHALKQMPEIKFLGDIEPKGGIFAFYLEGVPPTDLATFLDRQGVAVRSGKHCAMPLLATYDLNTICRASLALYNHPEDIDQWMDAMAKARDFFSRRH